MGLAQKALELEFSGLEPRQVYTQHFNYSIGFWQALGRGLPLEFARYLQQRQSEGLSL